MDNFEILGNGESVGSYEEQPNWKKKPKTKSLPAAVGVKNDVSSGLSQGWVHWNLKSHRPTAPPPTGTLPHPKHKGRPEDVKSGVEKPVGAETHLSAAKKRDLIPSAPPLEQMDIVSGYEGLSYDAVTMPPPDASMEPIVRPIQPRGAVSSGTCIAEEDVRRSLVKYVSQQCCYGTRAARKLTINKMHYSSAFHYKLETFTEKRQTAWAYEPHSGEMLDTAINGQAPLPWDIRVPVPTHFENHVKHIEVPHTASLKPCTNCKATGMKRCSLCSSQGLVRCVHCHGDGSRLGVNGDRETCFFCNGMGKEKCSICRGSGKINCKQCCGKGKIKCYIKLTVTWTNNVADHVVERTSLPSSFIKGVGGQVAFEEEFPHVWPINHFPDNTINMASAQLVQQHANAFPSERVLMQRHQVRIVPVTEVVYQWKSHSGQFYVYGFENKVYAPDYPQTCCMGCSII